MALDLRVPIVSTIHPTSAATSGYEIVAPIKCKDPGSCNFNRTHSRAKSPEPEPLDPLDASEFVAFNNLYGLTRNGTAAAPVGTPRLKTASSGPTQRVWPVILDIKGTKFGAPGDEMETTVVNGSNRVNRSCTNMDARCESKEVSVA